MEFELDRFVRVFNRKFNVFIEVENFEEFFERVKEFGKIVFVIDEFFYWVEEDKGIFLIFQYIWDEVLKDLKVFFVLFGFLILMMESFMSYKNLFYGRRIGQIKFCFFEFFYLKEVFLCYSWEEFVKVYGIIDGILVYFQYFDDFFLVEKNIENNFYNWVSVFYEDVERLLKDELRELIMYFNILKVINDGKVKFMEIVNEMRVVVMNFLKYFKVFEIFDFVKKEYLINQRKCGCGVYRVKDFYYCFWFCFVYFYCDDIEIGVISFEDFQSDFNCYFGEVFESVVGQFLIRMNCFGKLFFRFMKFGRWWYKGEEIDLVVFNSIIGEVGFFEVKWKNLSEREVRGILKDFERKVEFMGILGNYFGLIGKRIEGKESFREKGYFVFDFEDFNEVGEEGC